MKKYYIYAAVSVSGASILAIELIGTRILGPYYGVGLFLWSALITITLAALSLGYLIGGCWADKGPSWNRLFLFFVASGIWSLLIPLLKHPVLALTEPLGLRFSVLCSAFLLFFAPLMLLGMVSPYAVKLKTKHLDELGRNTGYLYAASTIASVFSALAVGFFFIPVMGVQALTLIFGIVLVITGVVGFILFARQLLFYILPILIIILLHSIIQLRPKKQQIEENFRLVTQSPYGEIRVADIGSARYLLIDGGVHTMENVNTGKPLLPYVVVMDLGRHFFQDPGKMLLIGLGGGTIAKRYSSYGWAVDAVEIDRKVIDIAREYFYLDTCRCSVFNDDGRRFLQQSSVRYNLIILDAFGSSSIPYHLISIESFSLISERLEEKGALMINLESVGWGHPIVKSLYKTLKSVFQVVVILPTSEPPNELGNLVILASQRELTIPDGLIDHPSKYVDLDPYNHWVSLQQNHAWDNRFEIEGDISAQLITDNRNSLDVQAESINLAARKHLHSYFKEVGLKW